MGHKLETKFLGTIWAGFASAAEDEISDTISIDEYLIRDKEASYLLKVEGDNMNEFGIVNGDMVVVERTTDFKNGAMVVVLRDDGYHIEHFKKPKKEIKENKKEDEEGEEGQIIGTVVGSFRKYNV